MVKELRKLIEKVRAEREELFFEQDLLGYMYSKEANVDKHIIDGLLKEVSQQLDKKGAMSFCLNLLRKKNIPERVYRIVEMAFEGKMKVQFPHGMSFRRPVMFHPLINIAKKMQEPPPPPPPSEENGD